MPHVSTGRVGAAFGAMLVLGTASAVPAQRLVLPAGTVIIARTTSPLESATAQNGQNFDATVTENLGVDEYTIIPSGTKVRGVITLARPATRQQSGVIDVVFDQLTFPDGSTIAISGKLTSTDSAERRQIKSNPNARVVLVGARGGIGAAIAGAGASRNTNSLLSVLGGLLSEGRDVSVPAETPLAVELDRAVSLRGRGRLRGDDANTIYTAAERVKEGQQALARLGYYRGAINGALDDATRRALFQFQVDKGLNGTGNLDGRTAQALGVNLSGGLSGSALTADAASALRRDAQSLVSRARAEIGATTAGRLDATRTYAQGDLELWFALSAFEDNASNYEAIVRSGGNADAAIFAGRALVNAARRVDSAVQGTRVSAELQNGWTNLRRQIATLDTVR